MTATKAVSDLFVSVVQLLTGTVHLVCKTVGLLCALATYATVQLKRRSGQKYTPTFSHRRPYGNMASSKVRLTTTVHDPVIQEIITQARTAVQEMEQCVPVAETLPAIVAAQDTSGTAERLHAALTGLGFQAPAVRRYVASVKTRIGGHEAIESLIKDGLRTLAS